MGTASTREPRQARSTITRERLLDAALECLIEYGYAGTSTVAVCQRAQLSRGAHLHHFATKDELLLAALDHLAHKRFDGIAKQAAKLANKKGSPELPERIRAAVDLTWSTFTGGLFSGALELWLAARTDPDLRAQVHRVERALGKEVAALFREMFPPEITDTRVGRHALRDITYMLRGLAVTRLLRDDAAAEEERVLARCAELMLEAAAAGREEIMDSGTDPP